MKTNIVPAWALPKESDGNHPVTMTKAVLSDGFSTFSVSAQDFWSGVAQGAYAEVGQRWIFQCACGERWETESAARGRACPKKP